MTLKELLKIFDQFGVKAIASLEQPFDPNLHDAVMQEASESVAANTVIKELQKGYLLRDRLLRPAMVVVSK
jgi:molecular chaperone GrpE